MFLNFVLDGEVVISVVIFGFMFRGIREAIVGGLFWERFINWEDCFYRGLFWFFGGCFVDVFL